MRSYRFYLIGIADRIIEAAVKDCADDAQALAHARQSLAERDTALGVEVWDKARRVASIRRD